MLNAMLRLEWRAARHWVIAAIVAAALLPVVSAGRRWAAVGGNIPMFLSELELWGYLYPTLAIAIGVALGAVTWYSDRRGGFVYALSLPLERWRYVALRYLAGLTLVVPVGLGLLAGGLGVLLAIDLPETLRGYVPAISLKFMLALVAVFSIVFAFAALPRKVLRTMAWFAVIGLAAQGALSLAETKINFVQPIAEAFFSPVGPLGVLRGRWMLIDV